MSIKVLLLESSSVLSTSLVPIDITKSQCNTIQVTLTIEIQSKKNEIQTHDFMSQVNININKYITIKSNNWMIIVNN